MIPVLCLGLAALWLSFGRAGGLYVVQTWLPLIGKFRYPSRIVVLLHLVLAVLAAIGFARLMKKTASPEVRLPRLISIVPWLSAAAAVGVWLLGDPNNAAPWMLVLIGPVLFFLAAQMIKDLARDRISAGFMLFLVGDLAAYGFTYEALQNTKTWREVVESLHQPPGSPKDGRIVAEIQIADDDIGYEGNDLLLAGWHQADGYEGLLPESHLLDQNISLESLRILGVRWINSGGNHRRIAGLNPTNDPRWLEVPYPMPRARLTLNTTTIADPRVAVRKLQPDGATVVDRDPGLPLKDRAAPGTATIVIDRPGRIEIQTSADRPQLLVLAERFSGGWTAIVDGTPIPILRAEIDFMGCVAPAGDHTIRFAFDPASVRIGRLITTMTLLLLSLYMVCRVFSSK